jgi:hypothetical protein
MRTRAAAFIAALVVTLGAGVLRVGAEEAAQQQPESSEPQFFEGLEGLKIGGLWYLSGQYTEDSSQVRVKRAYIDVRKTILRWGETYFEGRITPDVNQDADGDLKVRLKYAYGKLTWKGAGWQPWLELGVVHIPWLDFEEHVNLYRMQDTMFVERVGTLNSADFGVTFGGFLGPKIEGPKTYPGRYGSFAVSVLNGGGYHARETNSNKALEGRLTVRPLPDALQGLQLSYFGLTGKGNTELEPDWNVHLGMLSYEHDRGALTATYYQGDGNQRGNAVDADGEALPREGYSFFGELRALSRRQLRFILRFDRFDPDTSVAGNQQDRLIAGVGWDLGHENVLLLDYDGVTYQDGREREDRFQLTLQVKF